MTLPSAAAPQHRESDETLHRQAARVLVFDEHDRVLLARGHDIDEPTHTWWFTVGGGIDVGESSREAAVREVFEETGLQLAAEDLIGPVIARRATFDFFAQSVRQDEVFFVAHIAGAGALSDAGWTDVERDFMDELRWWDLAELQAVDIRVYPAQLPELAVRLLHGWDGLVHEIDDTQ